MAREVIGKSASGIFGVATKNLTEPHTSSAEPHSSVAEPQTSAAEDRGVNLKALDQAVTEAIKYPKITIWSTTIAAVMRYNQITTTRYSMSREAKAKLKQVLQEEYPELWGEIKKRLPEGLDAE